MLTGELRPGEEMPSVVGLLIHEGNKVAVISADCQAEPR